MEIYFQVENCLVLSIFVPLHVDLSSANPNTKLPVLLYIHGGAYLHGSSTALKYDGRWLTNATNHVTVIINYRVGKKHLPFLLHICTFRFTFTVTYTLFEQSDNGSVKFFQKYSKLKSSISQPKVFAITRFDTIFLILNQLIKYIKQRSRSFTSMLSL